MPGALAQRVPALPSTALAQANCGVGEQVTGLFRARLPPATGVLVRVGVRVGVKVGPAGVLVTVGVRVWVRVGVRVGVRVAVGTPLTPKTLASKNEAQPPLAPVTVMRT